MHVKFINGRACQFNEGSNVLINFLLSKSHIFQLNDQSDETAGRHTSTILTLLCYKLIPRRTLFLSPTTTHLSIYSGRSKNFFCVRGLSAIHATQIAAKQAPRIKREFRYAKRILNGPSESLAGGKEDGRESEVRITRRRTASWWTRHPEVRLGEERLVRQSTAYKSS